MTPKQLHIACDFFLILLIAGILLSIFLFFDNLDRDIFIVKDLLNAWKKKPIHILQDSYQMTCEEMGMVDIVDYNWPGTSSGCFCSETVFTKGKCNEKETQLGCKNIKEIYNYQAKRWKSHFLCSSSIKSKSYFELSKVKQGSACAYRYKKCGVIDTLNNYLCIPENESCPLNSFSFSNTLDQHYVRIDTSNSNEDRKIFSNFVVAEDAICLNHNERHFEEAGYLLLNSIKNGCRSYINHEKEIIYNDKHYEKLDSYSKKVFYEDNAIFPFLKDNLPNYPSNLGSTMYLYASVFPGWRCDRKEFHQFRNGNIEVEIADIMKYTEENNFYLYIYSLSLILIYIVGVVHLKYSRILLGNYKIEISSATLLMIIVIYSIIIILDILLFYTADVNFDVVKKAKLSNDFFELVTNNECSDSFTNSTLKYVAKAFFNYLNRYFNIKILSFLSILISSTIILISIFAKPLTDRKKKNYSYKQD